MPRKITCIIVDDEPTAREILQHFVSKLPDLELVGSCKNAIEAIDMLQSHPVDLVFLDIRMPDISGISLAETIKNKAKIIFTTAFREYAVDGFDLQAVDYLLKPISLERFVQAVQKYRQESEIKLPVSTEDNEDFFFVRSERKMVKIPLNDIQFIESLSDYVKIHLDNDLVITREPISTIESKLNPQKFIRIHRSFIVSANRISSYTKEGVELGEKYLPISRTYRKSVLDQFEKH